LLVHDQLRSGTRWIRGDKFRLAQCINNLISNAEKFTTDGSITLTCTDIPEDSPEFLEMRKMEPRRSATRGSTEFFRRYGINNAVSRKCVLQFSVSDTGIGLSENMVQKIKKFLPFTQADGTTTRLYGGLGLGLPLTQRLVHMMGGDDIKIKSELNHGSTFTFTVQLEKGENKELLEKISGNNIVSKKNRKN